MSDVTFQKLSPASVRTFARRRVSRKAVAPPPYVKSYEQDQAVVRRTLPRRAFPRSLLRAVAGRPRGRGLVRALVRERGRAVRRGALRGGFGVLPRRGRRQPARRRGALRPGRDLREARPAHGGCGRVPERAGAATRIREGAGAALHVARRRAPVLGGR